MLKSVKVSYVSVYDHRDRPAYPDREPYRKGARNPFIVKWWTEAHDKALVDLIAQHKWLWYWYATDAIVALTPDAVLDEWRKSDPECQFRVWYNALMMFAESRIHALGLQHTVPRGGSKVCPLCGNYFLEESLPVPLVNRLGIDRLDFCAPCLRDTVLRRKGDPDMSAEDICQYLRDLTAVLGRAPTQTMGDGQIDLRPLTTDERLAILKVLQRRPSVARVKEVFGSWRAALAAAGVA